MQKREGLGTAVPAGSPRRSAKARGASLAAAVLAFSVLSTLPAKAVSVCDEVGKTAIITTVGETVLIKVGQGADSGKILTNGLACGSRDTDNTDKIHRG